MKADSTDQRLHNLLIFRFSLFIFHYFPYFHSMTKTS